MADAETRKIEAKMKKKPKPPNTFQEVENYIREKKLNVNPKQFWDYFEAGGWYDSTGKPVLSWKQKLITWHGRDKRTVALEKMGKVEDWETEKYRKRIRDSYQEYLEAKSTAALIDIQKDGGQLCKLCSWLIDEILQKRKGG